MANEFVVKNGLHLPAGALGTPSLAFATDTDTGIYLSGANTFALVSGAASRGSIGAEVSFTPASGSNFSVTTGGVGQISLSSSDAFTLSGAAASSIYTANANLMIYAGTGRLYIGDDAAAGPLKFGTGAAVKDVEVGSSNTTSSTIVRSGTGGMTISSTGAFAISGAAASSISNVNADLIVTTGSGRMYFSDDAANTIVRLGSGAGVKTVTVGSTNTTSATTVQAGTGDLTLSSQDAFNLSGAGASGTQSNIYTVNVGLNIYTGTGTLALSADATANTVNLATGAGVKTTTVGSTNTTSSLTLQGGGNGITITSPGNVSLTSSTYAGVAAKVAMTTDVGGWIKHNNTYFVPAGGTGLQALLQAIIATTETPGTIVLGYGTHTINWTVATVVNQEVTIIGSGATINFSSTDADCCLIFSSRCVLRDIYFTGPNPGWLAPQMVRVQGAFSEIVGCNFNGGPVGAGTSYLLYVDAANVLVDQCQFTAAAVAGAAAVDDSIYLSANSYRSKVLHSYFTCDFCSVGPILLAASTLSVVIDACDFYCANALGLARITFEAGTSNCVISNCNWKITAASAGRVLLFTGSDTGGSHLITHNNISEASSAVTTRVSCIWVAQPNCRFDSNIITTSNRTHGGAPDANRDRAAIYILAHHCSIVGNLFDLSGSAQEAIVVLNTGNVAVNVAMLGVFISNNYFYNIDGVTVTGGYGVWVYSTAAFRPANGVVDTNKFHASGNVSNCIGCAAANGAINWTAVGNGRSIIGAFTVGDWVSGGAQMIASNQ